MVSREYLMIWGSAILFVAIGIGNVAAEAKPKKALKQGDKCSKQEECDPLYTKGLDCVKHKCTCPENVFWDEVEHQCIWMSYLDHCKLNKKKKKDPAGNCAYGLICVKDVCKCQHENTDICDGRVIQGLVHARTALHKRDNGGTRILYSKSKFGILLGSLCLGFCLASLIGFGFVA